MTHQGEGETAVGPGPRPDQAEPLAADSWSRIGRISRVQVYPLKSAGAPPAGAVALDQNGAVGDRWFVVTDPDGTPVTAQDAPELRAVVALLAMDGGLVLHVPGVASSVRGERADEALSDLLGRPVRIVPATRSAARLDAPVHLISVQSLDAARRGEHANADCACSLEEPRANLLLDLTGALGEPGANGRPEAALVGHRLRIGSAQLEITRTPGHCLGIYADVLVAGALRPGDTVELLGEIAALAEVDRLQSVEAGLPDRPEGEDRVVDLREPQPAATGPVQRKKARRSEPATATREQRTPQAG
jgi:uncharacterized protein